MKLSGQPFNLCKMGLELLQRRRITPERHCQFVGVGCKIDRIDRTLAQWYSLQLMLAISKICCELQTFWAVIASLFHAKRMDHLRWVDVSPIRKAALDLYHVSTATRAWSDSRLGHGLGLNRSILKSNNVEVLTDLEWLTARCWKEVTGLIY
jgi:hypothetical protein